MLFSAITFCVQSAKPASAMAPMLAPEVRLQFAKRLRTMRTQRGFDRARYFARSLGIEENRYTRYERAEVEPSLTLIHKMCETLRVSPNELLGFAESGQEHFFEPAPGLAEAATGEIAQTPRRDGTGHGPDAASTLAWRLAAEAVAIRHEQTGKSKAASDVLGTMRETGALFRSLQARPFETAVELAADPALERVDGKRRAALAGLIRSYTDSLTEARPARTRLR
jgi:transcriptional regulator with XRE-family HTH domain